jgi:hypothetical protein
MIEKAVFSYFNPEDSFFHKGGYSTFPDFLYTTALAVWCARRHFDEVEMVSNDWGIQMFKKIGLPITHYNDKLNEMKDYSRFFWAYGKLLAYCEQTKPFIHLDNDVLLWDPLPKRILRAELCFQSHEPFELPGYSYYNLLKKPWAVMPVRPQKIVDNEVSDFAYNCGICGGHNLEFFEEWRQCSKEYIFAEDNQELFFREYASMLIHQNLFHEQYFAASLIKMHKLRGKVRVLDPDAGQIEKKLKYTHFWGTTKKDFSMQRRVYLRLKVEAPELHARVEKFVKKNKL